MGGFWRKYCVIFNKDNPFSLLVLGFLLHSVAKIFLSITGMQVAYSGVCVIGWILIIRALWLMRYELRFQVEGFQKRWIIAYMILCSVMIARGYMIDYKYLWFSTNGFINYHFFNPTYILPYLMPFVLFIPLEKYDFRPVVYASVIVSIAVIVSFVLLYKQIIIGSKLASMGFYTEGFEQYKYYGQLYINVAIIALCRKYVPRKVWILNTVALVLTLMINIFAGRRGNSLITAMLLCFNLYFLVQTFAKRFRGLAVIAIAILGLVAVWLVSDWQAFDYMKERGMQDNRSYIDEALMNQMSETQVWFGKGLNGRYFFDLHLENDYLDGYRYVSETGYYNLILKGGYVFVWVYIFMMLYPAYLGMFKSSNLLCKALGFLLVLSILELWPFGHLMFNLKFLVLWMGVAICSCQEVREMDDRQIYLRFFSFEDEDTVDNKFPLSRI